MDLTKKPIIKALLKKYGATAEKKLGQHFILSKKALARMIAVAEIEKGDTVIEIGPGLGTLTQELAETGAKIIAIEKDGPMLDILKETLADYKNVKIIQADARTIGFGNLSAGKYKIVA
ncbi:MAG: rRNA adenine N-6-methyltransferase family protein, partial [Candidatus Azambacteria bacterium]|nr:rRNA adenine N-6-methyltransferase family protein [Candidatus Azambacteria bacterium]